MPTSTNQHVVAMTAKPQAAYLTPTAWNTAGPYNWRRILQSAFNAADYRVNTQRNKGAATGTFYANESRTISHEVSKTMPFEANSVDIVRLLYAACGQIASANPTAGVYQHTVKLLDLAVSQALPHFGIAERAGTGLNHEFPGCNVERLLLSGDGIGIITGEATWSGSGKRIAPSGMIVEPTANFTLPAPTNLVYWKNTMLSLSVADSGTLANPVNYCANKRVNKWSIEIQNTLSDGLRPCAGDYQTTGDADSGAIRSERFILDQTITPQVVVRVEPGSVELQYLQEQRKLDFKLALTGKLITGAYYHALQYAAPISVYSAVQTGEEESFLVYTITAEPLSNLATGDVYSWLCTNDQAGSIYV